VDLFIKLLILNLLGGDKMKAYVLIKTTGGKARDVLDKIRAMDGVEEASGTYGSFDIIAKMEVKDLASLVIDEIRRLDGVVDTNTLIVAL